MHLKDQGQTVEYNMLSCDWLVSIRYLLNTSSTIQWFWWLYFAYPFAHAKCYLHFFLGKWRSTNKSLEIMIFLFHNSMIWIFKDLPTITLLQSKTINVFLLWDICKADHCMGYFLFNKTHQNNIQIVHRLDNRQSLLLRKFNPMS